MGLVLATGLGIGLVVNAASENGLELGRDYFPSAVSTQPKTQESVPSPEDRESVTPSVVPETPIDSQLLERLASKGLRAVTFEEVVQRFEDPMYSYEAYVFIDARDDDHYAQGHIPGAHQFDHYRADRFQEAMLQLIPTSMDIVVYCNGGDCEDSESAALFLLGLGADPTRVAVFTGGITEWTERGMPVERGAMNSGDIEDGSP
jgi:rhodanese-related sulfurtransferase